MKQQNEHDFSHKKFRDTIRIEEKNAEKYFSLKQILIAKYAVLPFLTTSLRTFFLCDKKNIRTSFITPCNRHISKVCKLIILKTLLKSCVLIVLIKIIALHAKCIKVRKVSEN